jgi:GAF domain-containing protein
MADLSRKFAVATPVEDTLKGVTAAAVELIDGVDCADVLLIRDGEFHSKAPTSDLAPAMDQVQRRTGEGPCLDATDAGIIRCDDLDDDPRWPQFAAAAVDAGVRSVLSFQLYTHGADSGALNLFGAAARSFDDESQAIGAMLATHAAIALIAANREHQFESALASRDIIGQAKGMIMLRFDVDAIRAFELLRMMSQNSNTPVRVIAAEIVQHMGRRPGLST